MVCEFDAGAVWRVSRSVRAGWLALGAFAFLAVVDVSAAADAASGSEQTGDPISGKALLTDMSRASCLICHEISSLDEKDQGQIGPMLDGVASRLPVDEIRQRIVDARVLNPETIMPPYFSTDGLYSVGDKYRGSTIYSAQEVADVLAYVLTLTDDAGE